MDMVFIGAVLAIAGLGVGSVLTATYLRLRSENILQSAVAHGRSVLEVEVATQVERRGGVESDLRQARAEIAQLKELAEGWRRATDTAEQDKARLAERASRVSTLEAEAARLSLQLGMGEEQLRRLTSGEAQKDEALRAAQSQLQKAELVHGGLAAKLEGALAALHEAGERRAVLEAQAAHAGSLETQLRGSLERGSALYQQLTDLRESSGAERDRLQAELAAARESAQQLTAELASTRTQQATAQTRADVLARELAHVRQQISQAQSLTVMRAEALANTPPDKPDLSDDHRRALRVLASPSVTRPPSTRLGVDLREGVEPALAEWMADVSQELDDLRERLSGAGAALDAAQQRLGEGLAGALALADAPRKVPLVSAEAQRTIESIVRVLPPTGTS